MAESSLSIVWSEYEARIGSYLGWGRGVLVYGDTAWTNRQQFEIDGIMASQLRRFYFLSLPSGRDAPYEWSFLKPTATLAFAVNTSTVPLPDDFNGFEGPITVLTTNSTAQPWQIEWRSEASIRQLYAVTPAMTGPPMFAAEVPLKGTTATAGQRWQLLLFPLADQSYSLQAQYAINPDYLSAPFPYAYGGVQHTETILEGCLAIAEERLDDSSGVHADRYQTLLRASIAADMRHKPQKLGYNRDRSDECGSWNRGDVHYWAPAATYNGGAFQ